MKRERPEDRKESFGRSFLFFLDVYKRQLLLFAETDTIRFRSTCLLLKKKSNPDSFFSFSNTVPTVSLRTSRPVSYTHL